MNYKYKVSVIMPVYNAAPFIKEAIASILAQTFTSFEFIIVNDGSTDNSKTIIEQFTDSRIKFIDNVKNEGVIKTRNQALSLCTGEYIACMDADDISLPFRFEKQVNYLDTHPQTAVVATKILMIDEAGKEVGYWNDDYNTTTSEQIQNKLPVINCIAQPAVMMRSKVVKSTGYHPNYIKNEDWGLWLTILSEGGVIAKLDEVLLKYRLHQQSETQITNNAGIGKKILNFKFAYLKQKLNSFNFKRTDKQVLKAFIIDFIKYNFTFFYFFIVKVRSTRLFELVTQLKNIKTVFSLNKEAVTHIFFFPFYHIGGAEGVHAAILETVKEKNAVVLITSVSSGNALLPAFKKNAIVIDCAQLLIWPFLKNWLSKKIIAQCLHNPQLILFGCNSRFFYSLIAKTPRQNKAIDLLHAFMHAHEDSAEKWSLPVVNNLSARVVINKKTAADLALLYKEKDIAQQLADRIIHIPNYVDKHIYQPKNTSHVLNVLYVGRGTSEKRVHLIAATAAQLAEKGLPFKFHFIGDVKAAINPEHLSYCTLHGELTDRKAIEQLYAAAHLLVIVSSREGFPMVIMEAMMHTVVPVSTNVGGIAEHISNKINGILINSTEATAIVNELVNELSWLHNNRNELEKMAKNAHEYALAHFDKQFFINAYRKILNVN